MLGVTEEPQMSAEQAIERSWLRLRRAHLHRRDNPGAKRWDEIGEKNHFAESVAESFRQKPATSS